MSERIEDEFLDVDLGDKRCDERLRRVAAQLFATPGASIAGACQGWSESMAAYRLLDGARARPAKILAAHQRMVLQRARAERCLLIIQDTTEIDLSSKKTMEGRGPLNDESRRGFFLHSQYAVSEAGLPLGLLGATILTRTDEDFRQPNTRKQKPIEEKESYRWLEGYLRAQEVARQLPEHEVISISDREGDLYEVFAAWKKAEQEPGPRAQWLIRARQNRALEGLEGAGPKSLFATLAGAPELGTVEFSVTAKRQRKKSRGTSVQVVRSAREVRQRVRAMRVTPRVPFRRGRTLPEVSFWAVLTEEIDPPEGEEPLSWLLLTSLEVPTLEAARRIIALYLRRWDIEVFHRVLKSGCRVEQIQLKGQQAVHNCLTLWMIIAWRLLYLTHLGRHCPELPCSVVFTAAEWKSTCTVAAAKKITGYQKTEPLREPTLSEFIDLIARLGGYLGRNSDLPPGAQIMWQGLARVRDFACTWEAIYQR